MIFFEMLRKRMVNNNQLMWFDSLDKPFQYNRVKYMVVICLICYVVSSPSQMFSFDWIVYFLLFLAIGIVADILTQYIIHIYGKKRCAKQIEEIHFLQNELIRISEEMQDDFSYDESPKQYEEEDYLKPYLTPEAHVAYLSVDGGKFIKKVNQFTEVTFDVEPYGNIDVIKQDLSELPIQVTKLTPSGQMPFKDNRIDVIMCMNSNYDKFEIQRVLKPHGYFIVNQMGTGNFREMVQMYVPYGLKGTWDAPTCMQTLTDMDMRIIDHVEEYGNIRFRTVQAMHTYFKKISPDLMDMEKYKTFYLNVLKSIQEYGYYDLTTHRFLVVAQNG